MRRTSQQRGLTLIEVLIAITLVSLLSAAMLYAMRAGLVALESSTRRIDSLRRADGAQQILRQQVAGLLPVMARCGASPVQPGGPPVMFFEGRPHLARFVTKYSIREGAHGRPQIVELFVAPRPEGGLRLLANELPYTGPEGAGFLCQPAQPAADLDAVLPAFPPPQPSPQSFVLADRLASCRFSYLQDDLINPPEWLPAWRRMDLWPAAVRVEMQPLEPASSPLPALVITVRIRPNRMAGERYEP